MHASRLGICRPYTNVVKPCLKEGCPFIGQQGKYQGYCKAHANKVLGICRPYNHSHFCSEEGCPRKAQFGRYGKFCAVHGRKTRAPRPQAKGTGKPHKKTTTPRREEENATPASWELQEGSEVMLWGLEVHTDLNGERGTCLNWREDVGRWTVKLDDAGESYQLKPQNLVLRAEEI